MKTFSMYAQAVITSEHGKILLLKHKRTDGQIIWDLPGAPLSEEDSFDEVLSESIPKDIGYYIYPGRIVGVGQLVKNERKEVHVILRASILNGELLLSNKYESYIWVNSNRISEYPLAPWLSRYVKENRIPFTDVAEELDEIEERKYRRQELYEERIVSGKNRISSFFEKDNNEETYEEVEEYEEEAPTEYPKRSSFSILKDAIKRTFHPKEAKITRTQPKYNPLYDEVEEEVPVKDEIMTETIVDGPKIDDSIFNKAGEDDIIPEHVISEEVVIDDVVTEDIVTDDIVSEDIVSDEIVIDHSNEVSDVVKEAEIEKTTPKAPVNTNPRIIDSMHKAKIPTEKKVKTIREGETPLIRKEKESNEKISFNSGKSIINRLNKPSNEKRVAPKVRRK